MATKNKNKNKNKNKGKHHLPHGTYRDIMLGLGGEHDPVATWKQAGPKQRAGFRRKAKARGKTLQGVMSGGAAALQEKSNWGMRRQAERTIKTAYAPAEAELSRRNAQTIALNAKQQQDELMYSQWEMGEQAKMRASSAQADQAFRDSLTANAIQEKANWDEQQAMAQPGAGADAEGARQYTNNQVSLRRQASEGVMNASRQHALSSQAQSNINANVAGEATLHDSSHRKQKNDQKFRADLEKISTERGDLNLKKAADVQKETDRIQDQQIDIASSNRNWQADKKTLGIKEFEAESDRIDDKGKRRLANKKLSVDARLKRIDQRLKGRDLSRKERDTLEKRRHNLRMEANNERKTDISAKNANKKDKSGDKTWGKVEEAISLGRTLSKHNKNDSAGMTAKRLRNHGATPLQARAAAEIIHYGHVKKSTADAIKRGGGTVPRSARG